MDRKYWEKIAPTYHVEIFDVLANDSKELILNAINSFASKNKSVIDIGCAIGKWLPVLSPVFKKVFAIDISVENLNIAKKLYPDLTNIVYSHVDMSNPKAKINACDFGICINAILTDSLNNRNIFFSNLKKCIKTNGHLVLVIPSLESFLLTAIIRQKWDPDKDAASMINKKKSDLQFKNILEGNAEIDNVPTKHYLKEELELLLINEGFSVIKFHKIEYEWNTEFLKPPKWLKQPMPWDWMVLAKKN